MWSVPQLWSKWIKQDANMLHHHCAFAIVNRDLVLTPKQGLQLSGKRIFYDENALFMVDAELRNSNSNRSNSATARPWERTLKHVTYLTLFTNAATGIITGNFSKVKEYNDFLQSPYIRSPNPNDSRFGDIVTLAQGRLESMSNGTYRFVEGNCDYECARENHMVAHWHVQKIRHRDVDRKFHYEMKFSVSPMTTATPSEIIVRGGPNKRTIMESTQYQSHNNIQTFIQKEADYPHSFSKILSSNQNDDDFAERRYDGTRNFRQINLQQQHQQVTPMPQPTFLRSVYRPAPSPPHQQPLPPHQTYPENLNIGEYYKGSYGPKASPKIELFPNLLSMMFGKPNNYSPKSPTTFRPPNVYQQMKFPRPEMYTLPPPIPNHQSFVQRQEYNKLPEYYPSHEQFVSKEPHTPVISHHYHHHYFVANSTDNSGEEQSVNSSEGQEVTPTVLYKNDAIQVVTPLPHYTLAYNVQQQQQQKQSLKLPDTLDGQYLVQQYQQQFHKMPPAPQKFVFPITEIEQHRVVHVTPVSPLKKPHYQQQYYQPLPSVPYTTGHGPFVVYPAPVEEEKADVPTPRNKPFVQSQPLKEENIRYSEPDPLYAHITEKQPDEDTYGGQQQYNGDDGEPQLELPQKYEQQIEQETEASEDDSKEHSDSVEAQVQAPHQKSNVHQYYANDSDDETDADTDADDNYQAQSEVSTPQAQVKQQRLEQKTSPSTTRKISTEKVIENTTEPEASNSITLPTTAKSKVLSNRSKRVRLKVTKLVASSTPKTKIFSTKVTTEKLFKPTSTTPTSDTITSSATTTSNQFHKQFVSTSTTESPLKSLTRYRSSNKRLATSTTTTEKPVLKWKPRRKDTNAKALNLKTLAHKVEIPDTPKEGGDDSNAKPSNREVTKVSANPTTPSPPSTNFATERSTETTTEISNDATIAITSTSSTLLSSGTQSAATTSESEIYEVLTQKSVSYKIGENGKEVPLSINDAENEVKV